MNRSELIDHRISNLCTERVCVSRLAWFHPSQTEIRDRCGSRNAETLNRMTGLRHTERGKTRWNLIG